ncbi:hypothetical protein NP493_743g00029 [Ridgeia piscesae]|uniref:Endonuclease/exonuclease/phosphatase domain-containing protein n=1 Tax=Ridgeia piscesae TaxID=27915 RepID=A0AAD9KPK8_RIDPI|nr:hypothetical protein NP493_743g00029 [Ridgeia piscesae]
MLSHEAQNALISWEAAGPRIIYASFKTKKENIKLNIIQCYAPTNDKDQETKEYFYNKLQTLCDKLKEEKDMTILMGDFNAKIGSDNSGVTTETFRLTVRNKYEALQDLVDEGNMDIDTQWQQIKEMWTSTCSEVLGKKKYQQKAWISANTFNKVQVRKGKKRAINNSRTRAAKATAQEENRGKQSSQEQRTNRQGKLH